MPRDKANKNAGVQFTRSAAKDIADVVRIVRSGNRKQPSMGGRNAPYPSSHYLSKTTAQWTKGTTQSFTIYVGDSGSEGPSSGSTVEAGNNVATLPSGVRVLLARANGAFYLASFDFTSLPSYSEGKQQVLGHSAGGSLVWIDTTTCT